MAANKLAFIVNSVLSIVIVVSWVVFFVQPLGMITKISLFYSLDAGFFTVKTSAGVASMAGGAALDTYAPDVWGKTFRRWQSREWEFSEWREFICQIPRIPGYEDHCAIWSNIQMANYIVLCLVPTGLLLMLGGVLSMYFYNFVQASGKARRVASGLFQVSFVVIAISVATYWYFVQYVMDMFPRTSATPLGYNGMMAICVSGISLVPAIISLICTGESDEELLREIGDEQKRFLRQQQEEDQRLGKDWTYGAAAGYGAAPLAPAPAPVPVAGIMGGGAVYYQQQQPVGGGGYQQQQPQW